MSQKEYQLEVKLIHHIETALKIPERTNNCLFIDDDCIYVIGAISFENERESLNEIRIYDAKTKAEIEVLRDANPMDSIHVDDQYIYGYHYGKSEIMIWDRKSYKQIFFLAINSTMSDNRPSLKCLYSSEKFLYCGLKSGYIRVFKKKLWDETDVLGPFGDVHSIITDEDFIYIGDRSGVVVVVDKKTKDNIKLLKLDCGGLIGVFTCNNIVFGWASSKLKKWKKGSWEEIDSVRLTGGKKSFILNDYFYAGYIRNKPRAHFVIVWGLDFESPIEIKIEFHRNDVIKGISASNEFISIVSNKGTIIVYEHVEITKRRELEKRINLFRNIVAKTDFLDLNKSADLLDFNNKVDFMNWIYSLPAEFPFIIKGEQIFFDWKEANHIEINKTIDEILKQFKTWKKEAKNEKIKNIMLKTVFIDVETLSRILKFDTTKELMNWFYSLPSDLPFIFKGDEIHFQWNQTSDEDIENKIDTLLRSYMEWEKNPEMKSND